ncbi:MAG: SpoIIE family protein phosphatase [Actinomycetota bacterium]|nr:SpoIIE family protein phosphatase [Actinomycetota bacterium]
MLRVRTFLIIILLVILLPMVALDFYNYEIGLNQRRQIILDRNEEVARSVAVGFRAFIFQAVQTEEAGGLAIAEGAFHGDQVTQYLKELQIHNPHLTSITYFSPAGKQIASSSKELNPIPQSSLREISRGPAWFVTPLHLSPRGRGTEFHVISEIRIKGRLVALVSGVIEDRMVFDFIKIRIGQAGNIGIIDNRGRAVALSFRRDLTWKERDRLFIPSIRSALRGRLATINRFRDPLGNVERMGASVPIKELGWVANVFQPVSEVLVPVQQDALFEAGTSLLVTLAALVFVLLVGRVMTKPIMDLAAQTEPFKHGEYSHRLPTGFRVKEISELAQVLNLEAAETQKRFEVEQHIAGALQASLLPVEPPELPGYEIGTRYASATEHALVGGDFYDFIFLGDDKAGIVIGDVQGKGVDAAVTTVTTKFALRDLAVGHPSPAAVLKIMNKICWRELMPEQFITLIYLVLDMNKGTIEYASAGHHPPIICTADGCRSFTENGTALGILENAEFNIGRERLSARETLVLYTDGIIEARLKADLFGLDRLSEVVAKNSGSAPQDICELVYKAAIDFGGHKLHDDLALIIMKRTGAGRQAAPPSERDNS